MKIKVSFGAWVGEENFQKFETELSMELMEIFLQRSLAAFVEGQQLKEKETNLYFEGRFFKVRRVE